MQTRRYALTLSYDGSRFNGFQKQALGIPTVQTALENALSAIAQTPITITAAGRTDTGVHATAQVIHFDTEIQRPLQAWVRGVNAHLPAGVAIWHAQEVDLRFHARFDAFGRRYRYWLQSSAVRSPLWLGRAGWTHYALDLDKIFDATRCLLGEHDFSSFRAAECQAKSPIKTLYALEMARQGDWIQLDFHANAFLHHMVRNLVGAMIYVGNGRLSVAQFEDVFAAKSRLYAPPTFMADGLYLTGVDYPPEWGILQTSMPEFGIL